MLAVEIQLTTNVWRKIITLIDDHLNDAIVVCRRAVNSEKISARIREVDSGEIILEEFYNQADDPDYREYQTWDDRFREEGVNLRWQEVGF